MGKAEVFPTWPMIGGGRLNDEAIVTVGVSEIFLDHDRRDGDLRKPDGRRTTEKSSGNRVSR